MSSVREPCCRCLFCLCGCVDIACFISDVCIVYICVCLSLFVFYVLCIYTSVCLFLFVCIYVCFSVSLMRVCLSVSLVCVCLSVSLMRACLSVSLVCVYIVSITIVCVIPLICYFSFFLRLRFLPLVFFCACNLSRPADTMLLLYAYSYVYQSLLCVCYHSLIFVCVFLLRSRFLPLFSCLRSHAAQILLSGAQQIAIAVCVTLATAIVLMAANR